MWLFVFLVMSPWGFCSGLSANLIVQGINQIVLLGCFSLDKIDSHLWLSLVISFLLINFGLHLEMEVNRLVFDYFCYSS